MYHIVVNSIHTNMRGRAEAKDAVTIAFMKQRIINNNLLLFARTP
jgi:hypothetical protein